MKAISLKQPFASLIARGEKMIETRTWPTKYRGDVLICSSKRPKVEPAAMYPLGQALCIVRIANCRPMTRADEMAACCKLYPGAYAWELENIRPIKPFGVRGSLGFYEVQMLK